MSVTAARGYAEVTPGERRRLMAGAYLSMIGLAACTSPIAVCLTAFARSFPELTTADLGLISTVSLLGVVGGLLVAGPLADRWGLRPFMILGEVLEVAGLVALALAPTASLLVVAVGLVGVGTGLVDALASPLVAELQPHQRTRALNWLHAGYPLGYLAMGAVSALLLRVTGSWRVVFPVMTLPAVAGLVVFLVSRFPRAETHGEGLAALKPALSNRFFWIGTVGIFLAGATELGVTHWTPAYIERGLGRSPATGATVLLGLAACMLVGRLSVGALAHRVRPVGLMLAAAVASLGAILTAALAPAVPAMAALVFLGLAVACIWPTVMAYTADRVPRAGATVFSLLGAAGNAGGALSPAVIGLVAQAHGLRLGLVAAAVFPLAAAALMAWRVVAERREIQGGPDERSAAE